MPEEILADQESGGQDLELDVNRRSWVEFLDVLSWLICKVGMISSAQFSSLFLPVQTLQPELKTGPDTALINTITPWSHTEACSSKRWWEGGGLQTHECNGSFSKCDPMGIKKRTHI